MSKKLVTTAMLLLVASASRAGVGPEAPPASIEEPRGLSLSELPDPFDWTSFDWLADGLGYKVDLDLLAPLGSGDGNLATWLVLFMDDGVLREEAIETLARASTVENGDLAGWSVLPFDDPILLKAEPWVDQQSCRFYPGELQFDSLFYQGPDLSLALSLGRTWIARGYQHFLDPPVAKADIRRALRLGRLLLQDDVTVSQNLVATELIRAGVKALYDLARREGDGFVAALAVLALADSAALRSETLKRSAVATNVPAHVVEPPIIGRLTGPVLDIRDFEVDDVVVLAGSYASRALRLEALAALYLIEHMGTRSQSERAAAALERLSADSDPLVATAANKLRKREFDKSEMFMRASVLK